MNEPIWLSNYELFYYDQKNNYNKSKYFVHESNKCYFLGFTNKKYANDFINKELKPWSLKYSLQDNEGNNLTC